MWHKAQPKEEHPSTLHPEMESINPKERRKIPSGFGSYVPPNRIFPSGFGSDIPANIQFSESTGEPYDPAWGIYNKR